MSTMPWRFLRMGSKLLVQRRVDLTVDGLQHLPSSGPVILAARHYHHLYDGAILHAVIQRPLHLVVTNDWAGGKLTTRALTALCGAAEWPVVIRTDAFSRSRRPEQPGDRAQNTAAFRSSIDLLRHRQALVIFPEGYPVIDPNPTPPRPEYALLPFQPGVVRIAETATRQTGKAVPIVPVGFEYRHGSRWRVTIRFGPAVSAAGDRESIRAGLEARVRELSGLPA